MEDTLLGIMLVKMKNNTNHWNHYDYSQYIFRVLQFIRHNDHTHAVVLPYKMKSWKDLEIRDFYYSNELNPKTMVEIGISYLEVILEHEIPEDVKRDLKLDSLLNSGL